MSDTDDTRPAAIRLDTPWIVWITQALLDRVSTSDIVSRLAQADVPTDVARAEVERVRESPPFMALAEKYRGAVTAERVLAGVDQARGAFVVDTIDGTATTHDEIFAAVESAWKSNRPLLLRHVFDAVPALRWTFDSLRDRFGTLDVEVNAKRQSQARAALRERHSERVPFGEILDATVNREGDDLYLVSRNGLLQDERFDALHQDLVGLPTFLNASVAGRRTSLWIGPAGTHTQPHFDPHNVVLLQVAGRKRVTLTRAVPKTLTKMDGYFANASVLQSANDTAATQKSVTVELSESEALFVPVATFHEVVALEPSMTLSFLGFAWPNDFHHIRPA